MHLIKKKLAGKHTFLGMVVCLVLSVICLSAAGQNDIAMDWIKKANETLKTANVSSEERAYQEALNAFDRAIDIDPHLMIAWLGKLDMLLNLHRYDEFNRSIDEMVAVNPTPEGWLIRGKVLIKMGDFDQALASLNKSPRSTEALWLKGVILGEESHIMEALDVVNLSIECFNECIKIDPNHAEAWMYKGLLLNKLAKIGENREKEATFCFNKALELYNAKLDLNPNNKDAWWQKSMIFNKLGLTAEGKRAEMYAEGEL